MKSDDRHAFSHVEAVCVRAVGRRVELEQVAARGAGALAELALR